MVAIRAAYSGWTDFEIADDDEYAAASELRKNQPDAIGDHFFLFKTEAYVTYDNDYTNKRHHFRPARQPSRESIGRLFCRASRSFPWLEYRHLG